MFPPLAERQAQSVNRKADTGFRDHAQSARRDGAPQKESKVEEGRLMPDHVHMLLSIPPKYAVSRA
jgi:REP element-mobilizing transposase RayT